MRWRRRNGERAFQHADCVRTENNLTIIQSQIANIDLQKKNKQKKQNPVSVYLVTKRI